LARITAAIENAQVRNIEGTLNPTRSARSSNSSRRSTAKPLRRDKYNPEIEGVIESYELAFRMQSQMPAVMDLSKETDATKKLYGITGGGSDDMGRKCLLARKLVESGVRFVEICHGNWDHHFNLTSTLERNARDVDTPSPGCSRTSSSAGC
jgi:hypothetical protein